MRTAKTLIRLGDSLGWSESSLGAHSFCLFCHVAAQMRLIYIYNLHDETFRCHILLCMLIMEFFFYFVCLVVIITIKVLTARTTSTLTLQFQAE